MIIVHHLNNSRSQRVLWALEELGLPYQVVRYERDPATQLAPPALKAIHPLGKSPVIEDDGLVLAESGAIIEYLVRTYGEGRLAPAPGDRAAQARYLHWMHFAEGSAMLPLLLHLYTSRLGEAAAPLQPRIASETANHLGYMNAELAQGPWFMGDQFTAADIQMSFPIEAAMMMPGTGQHFAHLAAFVTRIQTRPAYRAAVKKGGPYRYDRG
ncbi:glutathione S-transferase family protein [Nitrospirillum viridazoti]|uniref:glutathione transferase n=1 Tax=Nitrospirillum amazonense TaxID=28077 RepID=A0A560I510_9PROT|nr:glutathione S-transferase family protein [Nitrospirillum amazonense]TWB52254.1 glutathione S-transferase [Nitrospirillum amazonense]